MKPIILFLDDSDKVTLTKEKLEKLIEDAYMQGKADGTISVPLNPIYPNTINTAPYNPPSVWYSSDTLSGCTGRQK